MREFELIERIRRRAGAAPAGVAVGIGDDAAVLELPPGHQLVATTDTLNEGVHFFAGTAAGDLGHKALAVNLSDLAAMGATPRWALLSLSLPEIGPGWLDEFMDAFLALAGRHHVALVGGDTCAGPLSLTVTALGVVEPGRVLTRTGARPGDLVVVSGTLGDAALAVQQLENGETPHPEALAALLRPQPRVALGARLAGVASAVIDISDGLLADLGHVAQASGCGAEIELERLPCSAGLAALPEARRWPLLLAGGDAYELCFTLPEERSGRLDALRDELGTALTVVGRMDEGEAVRCRAGDGTLYTCDRTGYDHFA